MQEGCGDVRRPRRRGRRQREVRGGLEVCSRLRRERVQRVQGIVVCL